VGESRWPDHRYKAILEVIAIVAASTITNYTGMIAAHAKGPPAQRQVEHP